ncbi:MAG: septation protein A [Thiomargarita sp.]|nr:septation protein A [Thiomargarita sp.]
MKFLFDLFPVLLFFIAYKLYDIYTATAVIIVASILQVGGFWLKHRRFEKMHLITLVFVVILGGATIFLQDENFIKWKPTVVNWIFAIAFLASQFIGKRNFLQMMLDKQIILTSNHVWRTLNFAWVTYFIIIGMINLYVAFNYDTNTWVNFKLFGMMGLTIIFVIIQGIYLSKYIVISDEEEKKEKTVSEQSSIDG